MALLSQATKDKLFAGALAWWNDEGLPPAASSKWLVMDAIDDLDGYLDTNAGAINNAIRAAARSELTTGEKAFLVAIVALARYDVDKLRRLLRVD